jgi:hypothetical protein
VATYASSHPVVCQGCGMQANMSLYLVVSVNQSAPAFVTDPGVPGHAYQQFHTCPRCQTLTLMVAPLLVTNFDGDPPLLFVPMDDAGEQENYQALEHILGLLRPSMGRAWNPAWVDDLVVIDRSVLAELW